MCTNDREKHAADAADGGSNLPPAGVTVIVPVRNRSDMLRRLLEALGGQSYGRGSFEVLVCDDGSEEDLSAVAARSALEYGLRLRFLRSKASGAGAARNLGLGHSRSEIVAFIDSDCVPSSGWLAAVTGPFASPDIGMTGGPYTYEGADHLSGRCLNFLLGCTFGTANAMRQFGASPDHYCPLAGNLAVRRPLAMAAGGFPEGNYGEDLEFANRVCRLGTRSQYVAEAGVLHNERRNPAQVFRSNFEKGAARVRLVRRLGMWRPIHLLPAALVSYFAAIAVLIAARSAVPGHIFLPAAGYVFVLMVLAVQGGRRLGLAPALAIPLYSLVIHIAYGCGFWAAIFGLAGWPRGGRPTARTTGVVSASDGASTSAPPAGPSRMPHTFGVTPLSPGDF